MHLSASGSVPNNRHCALGAIQGDRYFELKSPNESVDRRNPALDSEDAGGKNGCKCLLFGTDPEAFGTDPEALGLRMERQALGSQVVQLPQPAAQLQLDHV